MDWQAGRGRDPCLELSHLLLWPSWGKKKNEMMRLQHYPGTKEEPTPCASTRESLKFYGQKYSIKKAHVFLYTVSYIILIILFYIISFHLFFLVSKIIRMILLSLRTTHCHCSVTQSCPTLHSPMDRSTPSSSVPHYLPEFAHIHVHWVSDAV